MGGSAPLRVGVVVALAISSSAASDAAEPIRWDAAADTPAVFLARVEKAGAGLAAMPRLLATGPEAVVLAAASAQALGGNAPAEWQARLYEKDSDGERAFAIAGELVTGNYTRLLDLLVALGRMEYERKKTIQWQEIAESLDAGAGKDAGRAGWRNAATAIRMLALWRNGRTPALRLEFLAAFAAADPAVKKGIADAIAGSTGKYAVRAKAQYYHLLRDGFASGHLTDPVLGELLARIAPDPRAVSALTTQMANRAPEATAAMARAQAERATEKPEAAADAAGSLLRAGRRDEAVALLREAEAKATDPALRQRLRRQLFGILRSGGAPMPPGGRPPRPGMGPAPAPASPALEEELARRKALADIPPVEAALTLGDACWARGGRNAAAEAGPEYARAFGLATDPGWLCLAWDSWAATDPRAAWAEVARLDPVFAQDGAATRPEVGELACRAVAAGILADDEPGALLWATSHVPALATTPGGARARNFVLVWQAATLGDELPRAEIDAWLAGEVRGNDLYELTGALANGDNRPVRLTQGPEDQKLAALLRSRGAGTGNWDLAMSLATAGVPRLDQARSACQVWQQLLRLAPAPGKPGRAPDTPLAEEEIQAEAARQQKCAELTRACLERLDRADQRHAINAGRDFLGAAGTVLGSGSGARFLPHCQALVAGTLARAGKLQMPGPAVIAPLRGYAAALVRTGATAAQQAQLREQIRAAFPDDRQIQQFLAEIAAPPKP